MDIEVLEKNLEAANLTKEMALT